VDGEELPGRVVHFDPDGDIAVIAVDDIDRPVLRFDRDGRPRQSAAVLGYPNDGPYDVQAARIRSVQQLRSPDIYRAGVVVREVFAIRSSVRPGNSGGPLVSADGKVLGVIFAASMTDKQTGYALTADQVAPGAAAAIGSDDPVDTGGCT
jgi:S1-C subfamily serine protease